MTFHFSHHWKRYQGMFVFTVLAFSQGFERVGLTICNFVFELER